VQNAQELDAKREYYGGIPEYLHVAEQSFVERSLCIHAARSTIAPSHLLPNNIGFALSMQAKILFAALRAVTALLKQDTLPVLNSHIGWLRSEKLMESAQHHRYYGGDIATLGAL
jgi:hypothetical protein